MLCILRELLRNSGGPRCVSCNMREIPSEMEFHGFLGSLGNSDRSAHDTEGHDRVKLYFLLQLRGIIIRERGEV